MYRKLSIFLILVFLFFPSISYSSVFRTIRGSSDAKLEKIKYEREEFFEKIPLNILNSYKKSSGTYIVGFGGYTGSGQTGMSQRLIKKIENLNSDVDVKLLSCDDYIIPKSKRITRIKFNFSDAKKGDSKKVGQTGISIVKKGESLIEVQTPVSSYSVPISKIHTEYKIPGTEIYLEKQVGNTVVLHLPEFISKLDMRFYKDIITLSKGEDIWVPQFDQETRERLTIEKEELEKLKHRKLDSIKGPQGKNYLHYPIDEISGDIWVDTKSGEIYKRVKSGGIVVVEGVWTYLNEFANKFFDKKVFIHVPEKERVKRGGVRHILEGRYEGRMLNDILREMSKNWWETQAEYSKRQMDMVIEQQGYILDNSVPFSEQEMGLILGTEDERIRTALEVYKNDIANNPQQNYNINYALKYVSTVLTPLSPLYKSVSTVRDKITEAGSREKVLQIISDYINENKGYKELPSYQQALLNFVLLDGITNDNNINNNNEEVQKLISELQGMPINLPNWVDEYTKRDGLKNLDEMLRNELIEISQGIPKPAFIAAQKYGLLDSWGFKKYINYLIEEEKMTSEEIASQVGNMIPYSINSLVSLEKLSMYSYNRIPSSPKILILGSGNFSWGTFLTHYFEPSKIDSIDKDASLIPEQRKTLKKWGLSEEKIRLFQGDMSTLSDINELEGNKYNLVMMRTPFENLGNFEKSLNQAQKFLAQDGVLVLYTTNLELDSGYTNPISQNIKEASEELNLIQYNVYPLLTRVRMIPYTMKDKFTVLKKEQIEELVDHLH